MVKKYRAILFIFLIVVGVYLITISPTINWHDTPELVDTAYSLGIAHPAGFPTYSLTAKLFTLLPLGSIAFRVNLFSLFFAALSIILIYLIISEILVYLAGGKENDNVYIISIVSTSFLFVNAFCWQNSLVSEVYTFNMFFALLIIFLAVRFSITKEERYLYCAAFLYGISSGNHATVAFYLPALIIFYFLEVKEKKFAKFSLVCSFFLLGFSVYLYLPLRSVANPSYDWGNPESFSQFIMHITDRKTSYSHFAGVKDYPSIIKNLYNYLTSLNDNLTIIGIAFSLIGAVYMFHKKKSIFYLLFLILLSNTIFFFDWNGGVQLPSYICYIIFIALGIFSTFEWSKNKNILNKKAMFRRLIAYSLLIIVTITGINNFSRLNKSHIYTGEEDFKDTFLKLPGNSMVIVSYLYFHYKYYQDILGLKKDVTLMGYGEILYPKLFSMLNKDKYQNVKDIKYDIEVTGTEKVTKFINLNFKNFDRIFTEVISEFRGIERFIKHYDGFIFEFTKSRIENPTHEEVSKIMDYFDSVITNFVLGYDYKNDHEADLIFIQDFIFCIDYMLHYGYLDNVRYMIDAMLDVFGSNFRDNLLDVNRDSLKLLSGVVYIKKSEFKSAENIFKDMIDKGEYLAEAYNKLGFIYKYKEEYVKAVKYYKLAIEENPYLMDNYLKLGEIYELLGEKDNAVKTYEQGVRYLFQNEKRLLIQKIENLNKKVD